MSVKPQGENVHGIYFHSKFPHRMGQNIFIVILREKKNVLVSICNLPFLFLILLYFFFFFSLSQSLQRRSFKVIFSKCPQLEPSVTLKGLLSSALSALAASPPQQPAQ